MNGVAAGAGANLALACDLVLAAEEAAFVQAFAKIGLVPDTGGSFFLPRLIGLARATALMMLGEKVAARRAVEIGLIYRACPAATLLEEATTLAVHLAGQPTLGLGLTKRLLNASLVNDLDAQLELEAELQGVAGRSADYAEGVAAFLAKRKPLFTGQLIGASLRPETAPVGVLGAGAMGSGIAQVAAVAGHRVMVMLDAHEASRRQRPPSMLSKRPLRAWSRRDGWTRRRVGGGTGSASA